MTSCVAQDVNLVDHIAHFDRERIPERVVHAKGAGALGYFEVSPRSRPRRWISSCGICRDLRCALCGTGDEPRHSQVLQSQNVQCGWQADSRGRPVLHRRRRVREC
jgi:hypothetical protein